MPDYKAQVAPVDRWAIVAYIKALQLSQKATQADVPAGAHVEPLSSIAEREGLPASFADEWTVPPTAVTGTPDNGLFVLPVTGAAPSGGNPLHRLVPADLRVWDPCWTNLYRSSNLGSFRTKARNACHLDTNNTENRRASRPLRSASAAGVAGRAGDGLRLADACADRRCDRHHAYGSLSPSRTRAETTSCAPI